MKNLNKNIKKIWLIYYLLILMILFFILIIINILFYNYIKNNYDMYKIIEFTILSIYILTMPIIIKVNYLRYKYSINLNEVEVFKGIIFKKIIIIPLNKIQHTITKENPINKIFSLKNIKIYTTNKNYLLQGLSEDEIKKIHEHIEKYNLLK